MTTGLSSSRAAARALYPHGTFALFLVQHEKLHLLMAKYCSSFLLVLIWYTNEEGVPNDAVIFFSTRGQKSIIPAKLIEAISVISVTENAFKVNIIYLGLNLNELGSIRHRT